MQKNERFRFGSLDCLRGIFASMVVFHHMVDYTTSPVIHNNFFRYSNLFVDFFFVLSGFVISYSYQQLNSTGELKNFYRKRFFRLYPLHFFLLLVFVGFEIAKYYASSVISFNGGVFQENNLGSFFVSALLLNSVKWPFIHSLSWNYPSWSISAEMISYFFYSLVLLGGAVSRNRILQNGIFLATVLIGFGTLYSLQGNFNLIFTYDYGFVRGLIGFSSGVLCFRAFQTLYPRLKLFSSFLFSLLECTLLLLTFLLIWKWELLKTAGYIYEILFFISILVFAFERGVVSKALTRIPFFINLGKYSYSIYMTHAIIGIVFNIVFIRILKLPDTAYAYLFLLNFLIVYFVSRWTYHHVELYFQKRFTRQPKKAIIQEDQLLTF